MYKGFNEASRYLWISYALSDDEGNGREPAALLRWVRRLLPEVKLWQILQSDGFVAEGHQVGNHTYHHLGGFKHFTHTYVKDTNKANELIGSHLFRPPHGCMSHAEYLWLRRKYRIVMWDLVTRDYSKWLTADDVVENVKRPQRLNHHVPRLAEEHREAEDRLAPFAAMAEGSGIQLQGFRLK